MENEQLPAPPPSSSAGGTGTTPSSTGTARPPAPQISVYSSIPDRQTVQVIQQALHRQPNTAAQYLQQMYAAQQQHLMLQTAALQQQHLTSAQLQSLAAVQQASLAANRQSGSSGSNGTQPAPVQQPTINLATSPAAAQLLNRAQSVNPGASGIAQQAVLLGNAASPALTASQAQMYLRAQMVRGTRPHGAVGQLGEVHSLALRPAGPHLPALAMKPPGSSTPRAGPPRAPPPENPSDHLKKAEGPDARTHPLARTAAGPAAAHPLVTPAYAPLQPPQFLQQPPKPMQQQQQQQFVIQQQQQQQQQQLAPRVQPPSGPAAPQLQPLPAASPGPAPPPKAGAPHGAGAEGAAPNGHPSCYGAPRKFQHASAVILQLQPAGSTVGRSSLLVGGLKPQYAQELLAERAPQHDNTTTTDSEMEEPYLQESKEEGAPPKLKCELCGRVDFAYKFKRSKRFCSMACAKRYNVGCTKRVGLFHPDRSKLQKPGGPPHGRRRACKVPTLSKDTKKQVRGGRGPTPRGAVGPVLPGGSVPQTPVSLPPGSGPLSVTTSLQLNHSQEDSSRCSDNSSYEEPLSPISASSSASRRRQAERDLELRDMELPDMHVRELAGIGHRFLPSEPSKWNVEDVYEFIRSLPGGERQVVLCRGSVSLGATLSVSVLRPPVPAGCQEIAEEFRAQEIDGQALLLLKEDHLMSTMNIKLGPALKIYARISMLKDS
ncbi:hypothetical protein ASZ78_006088 [Callipepla squamata]|uniref:FCS-type domain-containing protein n=1 Tax=Callipepla squamata TaxID=9009 RepID=A0A226MZF7_CALSU|nr:hypothetical protein ASZ78_006088 [Callipepla squamata]